jgi:hypothetical protein
MQWPMTTSPRFPLDLRRRSRARMAGLWRIADLRVTLAGQLADETEVKRSAPRPRRWRTLIAPPAHLSVLPLRTGIHHLLDRRAAEGTSPIRLGVARIGRILPKWPTKVVARFGVVEPKHAGCSRDAHR